MILIDFNGLPGSGKSTICRCLTDELRRQGKRVITLDAVSGRLASNHRGTVLVFLKGLRYLGVRRTALVFRFGAELRRKKAPDVLYRLFVLVSSYGTYSECMKTDSADIVVSEQCCIQEIISCYHNRPIGDSRFPFELLSALGNDYFVVNAVTSVEVVHDRIRNRKNGYSRLDRLDEDSLKTVLEIQEENFRALREAICEAGLKHCEIHTEAEPEENAKAVIRALAFEEADH